MHAHSHVWIVCVRAYVCLRRCEFVYSSMYLSRSVSPCLSAQISIYVYMCVYAYMYTTYVLQCCLICLYIHMYVCPCLALHVREVHRDLYCMSYVHPTCMILYAYRYLSSQDHMHPIMRIESMGVYVCIYISADPGRRQGGERQGREVVDNKKCNNGFWEVFQSSRTATPARSNSSKI